MGNRLGSASGLCESDYKEVDINDPNEVMVDNLNESMEIIFERNNLNKTSVLECQKLTYFAKMISNEIQRVRIIKNTSGTPDSHFIAIFEFIQSKSYNWSTNLVQYYGFGGIIELTNLLSMLGWTGILTAKVGRGDC